MTDIRLLLVDDEVDFLDAMRPGLERRGFQVSVAQNGHAALGLLTKEAIDAVVLDVKMPGIDGVETFHEIKRIAPGVPVILLTGHGSIGQAFATSREGVADYLAKPCDVETLARVIRQAVANKQVALAQPVSIHEGIRVLLVDDDRDFADSVVPALERRGLQIAVASRGSAALQLVRAQRFDVAVVDVRLPDVNGLALVHGLWDEDPRIEVIILTGHPTAEDVRRGLKDGVFDYLTKPQPVEEIFSSVCAAFERRRERDARDREAEAERILSRRPD